jgi:serpin B
MPAGSIKPTTRLVIIDAQYMKATWLTQFDPEATREQPFQLTDGELVNVPMMSASLEIPYGEGDGYRAGEMPYVGDRLAMLIVVPGDLAAFEAGLSIDRLNAIVGGLVTTEVPVSLPRFEARQHSSLLETLGELGITDVGDIGGIGPGLFVSNVQHEAVVKVNEEGTEAAAATGIAVDESAPARELRADRPFLFFVRDRLTGAILFMGRVADPTDTD